MPTISSKWVCAVDKIEIKLVLILMEFILEKTKEFDHISKCHKTDGWRSGWRFSKEKSELDLYF